MSSSSAMLGARRSLRGLGLVWLVVTSACAVEPRPLRWTVVFESEASRRAAALVDARIMREACDGSDIVYRVELRPGRSTSIAPPTLAEGRWAFAATAYDGTCTPVASSCEEVSLPGVVAVENVLLAVRGAPARCSAARCVRGSCTEGDVDGDGHRACEPDELPRRCDCDDARPTVHPGAVEVCGDGIDQDCSGAADDGPCAGPLDRDADGWQACLPGGPRPCDVNDCDPGIGPGRRERCGNGVDEDGDGRDLPCAPGDRDGDGFLGVAHGGADCDDGDPRVYPGAPDDCRTPGSESCGVPASCEDQGGDADGDGYLARPPPGVEGDCDDDDPRVYPFAPFDPCDGVDQDCDGIVDEVALARGAGVPGVIDGCVRAGTRFIAVDFEASGRSSEHCGACGRATAPSEDCCAGRPTPVDEPSSCGECGRACGPRTACLTTGEDIDGNTYECACAPDADGDWADCDGTLGTGMLNGCETNVSSDVLHCGACGRVCSLPSALAACDEGRCVVASCDPFTGDCNGDPDDGCEARLDALPHCGACGETCRRVLNAAPRCVAPFSRAACDYVTCNARFLDCNADRSDGCETAFSTTNCGACGMACGPGEWCNAAGDCQCGMGRSTPTGPACTGATPDCCGSTCTNLNVDVANCGACGNRCGPNEACAMGRCTCGTTMGATGSGEACTGSRSECCADSCVNVQTSLAHCGACGRACASLLLNTSPVGRTCTAGVCDYSACAAGYGDCDSNRSNGCETSLGTTSNCGACGAACGVDESCWNGRCWCGSIEGPVGGGRACPIGTRCWAMLGMCF